MAQASLASPPSVVLCGLLSLLWSPSALRGLLSLLWSPQPSMVFSAFSGPLQPSVVSLAFFILCSTTCHLAAQPAQGRLPVSGRGRG